MIRDGGVDWHAVERLGDGTLSEDAVYEAMELFSEPKDLLRRTTDSLANLGWFLILARFAKLVAIRPSVRGRWGVVKADE